MTNSNFTRFYNCTTRFLSPFFQNSLTISQFCTPHLHTDTSKLTTAQFTFYNCKLHFTTAEIVISCTLKYALIGMLNGLCNNEVFCPMMGYLCYMYLLIISVRTFL